ncbi:hypothetical protein ACRZ5S_15135 [Vibrio scophthalmi]|uniref:hypothetical protein n=1 Tax=Vibrio TaxID=662 RepID=UPI00021BF026|nr:hypothetical protein [Vibrio sp. N418]EGU35348.1 hypothetical protein VIBRN418_10083 [Vibrio sp. N418]
MLVGCSKIYIMPVDPMPLGGFDFRVGEYKRVAMPIHCRCLVLNQSVAIVSLELLFVGEAVTTEIRQRAASHPQLKHLNVQICATHSHSSFQTEYGHSPRLGEVNHDYCQVLVEWVIEALLKAQNNQEPVQIRSARSICDFGVHRRVVNAQGCVEMAPNPNVAFDNSAHIWQFVSLSGQVKALMVHNHCHPTISAENTLSGEYPGVVSDAIEQNYPNAVCLFLQGFCGDIRPNLSRSNRFYRGDFGDVVQLGKQLANNYLAALTTSVERIPTATCCYREETVDLPLARRFTAEQLTNYQADFAPDDIHFEWAEQQLIRLEKASEDNSTTPSTHSVKLGWLNICDVIKLVTINAEVVNEYQRYITESIDSEALAVGYSNGMIGYIATAEQINQGGYEADLSSYYFYLPSTFDQTVETSLKLALANLILEK